MQAAGAAGVGVAGFWALASGDTLGAGFTSSFDPRFGVDGLSGLFLGTLGLIAAPALVFSHPVSGAHPPGACDRGAHRGFLPRARARRLCPRSTDVPHGLGVDDAALGHGDPRCAARRQAVAANGVQLPRRHPSRRRRHLDRDPAARARGRVRRRGCDQLRFGTADRDRPCGSGGDGDEGGRDAAACLAPARASDRSGSGLGADERGDDQGCAVRARARARGVGRRPSGLVRRAGARRWRRSLRWGASSTRCFSTISSGCSPCTRSRTSGSSCSGSAPA